MSYRPTTTTFLLLLAIRHIFFNSIIIIMVVNAGIYCPFRICLLHGSAVQRAAVRRTLIKEFYGSLLVLLEHFCSYDLVLEFFLKKSLVFSGTHPRETEDFYGIIDNIFLIVLTYRYFKSTSE